MSSHEYSYIGDELDLFALATHWKEYWHSKIKPYLGQEVLEVGAGIGGTTQVLCNAENQYKHWLGLEPDGELLSILHQKQQQGVFPIYCEFQGGTLATLDTTQQFDTILYIDVLEHIQADQLEISYVAAHLKKNGYLVVLSPAHNFIFSEFDRSIGHHRRYTKQMLEKLTPPDLVPFDAFYLDSIGLFTSLSNRFLLRQALPTKRQILLWDRAFIPISRIVDRLLFYQVGRSVIYVWKRTH